MKRAVVLALFAAVAVTGCGARGGGGGGRGGTIQRHVDDTAQTQRADQFETQRAIGQR